MSEPPQSTQSANHRRGSSRYTLWAVVTSIASTGVSASLYASGDGAGFEGWGAMLFGAIVGYLGTALALVFGVVALARKERYAWASLFAIGISLANLSWL